MAASKHDDDTTNEDRLQPVILDTVARTGATWHGRAVSRIRLILDDGEVATLPMPVLSGDPQWSDLESDIITLFRKIEPDRELKRVEIANLLGEPQGSIGRAVAALTTAKVLSAIQGRAGIGRGEKFPSR